MNHFDTDTYYEDPSEFGLQHETERCPITGVVRAPAYPASGVAGDSPIDRHIERRARTNSKLQAMFDKFLYQK